MSGIAGIVRFDGLAIASDDINNIKQLLAHRGTISSQPINNGLLLSFSGAVEVNQSHTAVADIDAFASSTVDQPVTTTYHLYGVQAFNHLNGDFATALWDTPTQTLYCARDILGVKPLYYVYEPQRFFAFASEIKALLVLQEVNIYPNQDKYIEYLSWMTKYIPYSDETFYENIYSVLPGHYLQVNAHQLNIHPYWTPNLAQFSVLHSSDDFAEAFKERFYKAVEVRMAGRHTVGAHLSGGLDSSSVSSVAQYIRSQQHLSSLHTFNIDTGLASTDESMFVQSVLDQHSVLHHVVHPVTDVLDSVLKISQVFDRPEHFIIPSSFHLSVSIAAKQVNCECILTGHDGDSVITTGLDYFDQLLNQLDLDNLLLACKEFVSFPDRDLSYLSNNWKQLNNQEKLEKYSLSIFGPALTKQFKSQPTSVFFESLQEYKQKFNLSSVSIVAYCVKRIQERIANRHLLDNALNEDFKHRKPKRTQRSTNQLITTLTTKHDAPFVQIVNNTNVICNEQLNHIGTYYGHQYQFPFFDKQVVEIGLATPYSVHFDQGRGRGLLRNGLKDVLPSAITSRLSKANFVEYGNISAQQLYKTTFEQFSFTNHAIWEVIDRKKFSRIVEVVFNPSIPMQRKTRYNWMLSRIIYLALWLDTLPTKGRLNIGA